jgi:ABC-2 type transport system permease protein
VTSHSLSVPGISLRAWRLLVRNQLLGFVREPAAAGFNLAVPFFIVLVQAFAYGDSAVGDELPGYRVADVLPIGAAVTYIMIIGVFGMGVGLASMVESRSLATFRLRPGGVGSILSAYGVVLVGLTLIGLALSTAVLAFGWGVRVPARPLLLLPAALLGSAVFLALGACVAGATGTPRSAQGVSSALFFPMLFLSGAMFPLDAFPAPLQVLAVCLPGFHLYEVTAWAWVGSQDAPWLSAAYLAALAVALPVLAGRLFGRREDL